jgi:hypothetical protein
MSHELEGAEAGILDRAMLVAEPAEWIGFFEWFTFARMYKVTILLVFGTAIFNVNAVFGQAFDPYVPTGTFYVLGVKLEGGESWSAVRPGSSHVDVNHFEVGAPFAGPSGLAPTEIDLTEEVASVLAYRQSATAVARDINLGVRKTESVGECGIDAILLGPVTRFIGLSSDHTCPSRCLSMPHALCGNRFFRLRRTRRSSGHARGR